MSNGTELIWVSKEMAEIYNKMESDDEKLKCVAKYIDSKKQTITADIEALDDDLLRFKAFALKYKTEIEKVYNEQSDALEKVFLDCGDVQSKMYLKIEETKKALLPIVDKIKEVNKTLDNINTYKIERMIELIHKFSVMNDEEKRILEIIINQQN